MRTSGARLAAYDGCRAIACLTVFLANLHNEMRVRVSGQFGPLSLPHLAESGVGVAFLIVLSGALLSVPFWRACRGEAPVDLGAFALKRLIRIAPAYYACLIALVLAGRHRDGTDVALHALFLNNLSERSFYGMSPQFWTIGLFVQLYVVLPVLFLPIAGFRLRPVTASAAMAVCAAGAYALHVLLMLTRVREADALSMLPPANGYVLSHSTLAHLPLFLLGLSAGSLLAARRPAALPTPARSLQLWLSLAAVVWLSASPHADALAVPYGRYLFPCLPALLAVVVVLLPDEPSARFAFSLPPLRWLGVVSYGVYVYHVTCMEVVRKLGGGQLDDVWSFALASLLLTLLVATASYVLLERPLRRWVERFLERRRPSAAEHPLVTIP